MEISCQIYIREIRGGWVAQLVKLVELRVKELEVQGSSPGKGEKLTL
jgi:hypothetical protein